MTAQDRIDRGIKYLEEATDNDKLRFTIISQLDVVAANSMIVGDPDAFLKGYFAGIVEILGVPEEYRKTLIGTIGAILASAEVPLETFENTVAKVQDSLRDMYALVKQNAP